MKEDILQKAKKYVNKLLSPLEHHYYHQYEHAIEVMQRAMYIGEKEWLSSEEIEMLWIAWLFHDSWFIIQYDDNEPIWAKIAKNFLRASLYPEDKIKIVEELILATDPEYNTPKNLLEKIIKDSDLDNLWREDFFQKANNLKKELENIKEIKIRDPDWHHSALDFLYEHDFYTNTQEQERFFKKEENTKLLESMIKELDEMEKQEKVKIEL